MKAKREAPKRNAGDRRRGRPDEAHRAAVRRRSDDPPQRRGRPRAGKSSAPARLQPTSRSGPQTTPMTQVGARPAPAKNTSQAKARANARKAKAPKVVRPPLRDRLIIRLASIDLRPSRLAAKVPFVVLVIGSLGLGLAVTLWLSTDSAERSYQLGNARQKNQALQQQKEALERHVLEEQAAPALAEAARDLGMIPTRDTAHLVQDPAGNWMVVGTPKPAEGVPPPPLNTKLPDEDLAPLAPPVDSIEVPVRVSPITPELTAPAPQGPEILLRAPNGATTMGTQHLPTDTGPAVGPGVPGISDIPVTAPLPGPVVAPPAPGPGFDPAALPPAAAPVPPPAVGPASGEQLNPATVPAPGGQR